MSVFGAIDSGLIPSRVKPLTLKLVFIAFLLDAQHKRDSVENKPASLLVLFGKALKLNGIPHLGVVDRWPATPKRAHYKALIKNKNNKFICQAPSHFMHKQINEVIDLTRC